MSEQRPRKPMGRPPTGVAYPHKITALVSDAQRDWLIAESARTGQTVGAVVRQLIEAAKTCPKVQVDRYGL